MKKHTTPVCILISAVLTMSFIHQNGWFLFETGHYKVSFPKKPSDHTQIANTELGKIKMSVYTYDPPDNELDDNYTYAILENEYPDSLMNSDKKDLIDKFFRSSIDDAVQNFKGKLLTESKIQLNGFPGREFKVSLDNGAAVLTMRFYLVKNTMYMLQTITGAKKDRNPSIGKFMDSFTLK